MSDSIKDLINRADQFYEDQELEKALEAYRAVPSHAEEYSYALMSQAAIMDLLDRPEQFLELSKQAAELNPHEPHYLFNVALAHDRLGQQEEALGIFKECTQLDKGYGKAWLALGNILMDRRNYQEALDAYNAIVDPEEVPTLMLRSNQAECLVQLAKIPQALEMYQAAILLDHDDIELKLQAGICCYRMGEPWKEEGRAYLKEVLTRNPGNNEARVYLASLCLEEEEYEEVELLLNYLQEDSHGMGE